MQNSFSRKVDQQYALLNQVLKQSIEQSEPYVQQALSQAAWLQLEVALSYWAGEIELRAAEPCSVAPDFFQWLSDINGQLPERTQLKNILEEPGWLADAQQAFKQIRAADASGSIKGDFFSTEEKPESQIIVASAATNERPWNDPHWVQSIARQFYDAVCLLRTAADEF